ncbi:hypothetical protein AMATHDRAFT_2218 [Amanita thiersii Skay4041]|uniref:Uncharacterized protein n=1 Tax=Amanita thiersii Skay4041 TaxID=703135 RepID=A0A2A9NXK2_9AGAR|nr:hypothetical protein AMATHDRAFT_2218 [Amanita thiersii Skay4041]
MFRYSRKSRQRSTEQHVGTGDNALTSNISPNSSNNNSANSNNKTTSNNTSPSSPSNPAHIAGAAANFSHGDTSSPSPPRPMSGNESEGYPSWLPKRPPPPPPASTIHSSVAGLYFDQEFGVVLDRDLRDADQQPSPSDATGTTSGIPYIGGRKPTPRSVRIVSLQESIQEGLAAGKGKQAVRHHHHTNGQPNVPSMTPVNALSRASGGAYLATATAQAAAQANAPHPRFNARGLHLQIFRSPSTLARIYFYIWPLVIFAHVPLQTFFDFNAVFILLQVSKFPNPVAPSVPGSGRNWALGAAAYIACWLVWILIVVILYETVYSFFRRWRIKRPTIMPLYLSSSAFNLVCMTSYTNFCFMQHLRIDAFRRKRGSLRDGFAETFYFYSQNLPTVALLLPRAGLCLALLFAYSRPLPNAILDSAIARIISRRDGTFFDSQDGSLTGYARGVLIANAVWTAWRIIVLLCSWVGLWILSGQGCAGLCGPRYRWEEEEAEKRRFSYIYGDAGSEDFASSLIWSWRECTRMRVQRAYEFCLTTERPAVWSEKKPIQIEPVDDAQILAAVGFPSIPPPARRSVLSGDLFEEPKEASGASEILPKVVKRSSKERQQLLTEPYPFAMQGAHISSDNRIVPFPHSSSSDDSDEDKAPSCGATTGGLEVEQPTTSSAKTRESASLSSFGQPVSSKYPFQFRRPAGSNGEQQRGTSESSSPATTSSEATNGTSSSAESSQSRMTQSTGNVSSSDEEATTSSDGNSSSGIPMPTRHPQAAQGRTRGRTRAGTVPAVAIAPSPDAPPVAFPSTRRTPHRYVAVETSDYEERNHLTDDDQSIASSHSEDDSVGLLSPGVPQSARSSPRTSLVAAAIRGSVAGFRGDSAPSSRAQSHSSEGSVSASGNSASASTSSRSFRSSLGSVMGTVNVSVVGMGTPAITGSRSGSRSRVQSSRSRPTTRSGSVAYVRSRAQSLMQGIGAASQSSIEIVQNVINRSRVDSMMTRLEEGDDQEQATQTLRVPPIQRLDVHESENDRENSVHADDGDQVDQVGYDERLSGLYVAQQQHAEYSYFSDARSHSRSGSGSVVSSSNENYTFGQPFPHRMRLQHNIKDDQRVEEEGEQVEREQEERSERGSDQRHSPLEVAGQARNPSTSSHSSSSHQAARGSQPISVPAALSPMRPRIYRSATAAEAGTSLSSSPPDMISTAAASFITAPATVASTTESSNYGGAGGGRSGRGMGWSNDMVDRVDQPGGSSWRPA